MKPYRPIYLLLISLALLFTGCIGENGANCPTDLNIFFNYNPLTYTTDGIDPSQIDRIDLFVFDEKGLFVGRYIDYDPVLTSDYYMTVSDLAFNQNYHFICWFGLHTNYFTTPAEFEVGKTTLTAARLYLEHTSGSIQTAINPLFHAQKQQYIDNSSQQRVDLSLTQMHNSINLTTQGLDNNSETYRLTVYDNNGNYNFDNSFAQDSDFTYTVDCQKDQQGQLSAHIDVLRLAQERSTIVEVCSQSGKILFRDNLANLINASGTNDYERTHTYNIHLKFGLGVSVSINGWWVVEDGANLN